MYNPLPLCHILSISSSDGFGADADEDVLAGDDEEGGGWDVGDEDLDLPPDLVSRNPYSILTHKSRCDPAAISHGKCFPIKKAGCIASYEIFNH